MAVGAFARAMLTHEARALLARLALIKPFALQEPMLPTAALMPDASVAIDRFLVAGRRELRRLIRGYLDWLKAPPGETATDEEAQRRFAILRLKFNVALVLNHSQPTAPAWWSSRPTPLSRRSRP